MTGRCSAVFGRDTTVEERMKTRVGSMITTFWWLRVMLLFIGACLATNPIGRWAFIKGTTIAGDPGNYSAYPPSRYQTFMLSSSNDTVYLFGGINLDGIICKRYLEVL